MNVYMDLFLNVNLKNENESKSQEVSDLSEKIQFLVESEG